MYEIVKLLRTQWYTIVVVVFISCNSGIKHKTETYHNPIIPGFAPDPSICRVGDDFYLINSTFEYFPGIPIYHSRDLVNWKLIGNALDSINQNVNMYSINSSAGIHAPTIRYHEGLFYIITTNNINGKMVNFIITAEDPRDAWSKAYVLKDAPGIDPSLFFDDDGKVWYTGSNVPPDPEFDGQSEIWMQEIDLDQMQLMGERYYLTRGFSGGTWAEGPHIYKYNDYYYLMIAEGGTLHNHAVTISASKNITGPYIGNARNPILTHRHLSLDHSIIAVGHGDMVQTKEDNWYMVALGFRPIENKYKNLGRETFLIPVVWETEPYWWKDEKITWPVCSPKTGKVEFEYFVPFPGTKQVKINEFYDSFDHPRLNLEWNFRRTPNSTFHSLNEKTGFLRIYLKEGFISEQGQYSFVGIRQRHFQMEAKSKMEFNPSGNEEAGITVIQNDRSAYVMSLMDGKIQLHHFFHGTDSLLAGHTYEESMVFWNITADYLDYDFSYSKDGKKWVLLYNNADGSKLSPESSGWTYTGVYVGLYGSSNNSSSTNYVDFDWFQYKGVSE